MSKMSATVLGVSVMHEALAASVSQIYYLILWGRTYAKAVEVSRSGYDIIGSERVLKDLISGYQISASYINKKHNGC